MIRLKEIRTRLGYSQKDVALLIGKARSTVTEYENGNIEPDIETIRLLCNILDISADELLDIKREA